MLTCVLNDIASTSLSIAVSVIIDERTFNVSLKTMLLVLRCYLEQRREGNFMLVTAADVIIDDSFIDTSGSSLETSVSK